MYTVLICDDEPDIVAALRIYLRAEGYHTLEAANGQEALALMAQHEVHLLLLDVMMPVLDGIDTLTRLRQENYNLPVILLTAKSKDTDKVLGLNIGADDYVTKPFNPLEVLARVRSHLRRYTQLGSSISVSGVYAVGGIRLDDRAKSVTLDGEPIALTPTEYDILRLMMRRAGEVLSPAEIYRCVWQDAPFGAESTIAVHIRHLREKLEIDPAEPRYLKVVWGKGYRLETDRKG